MRGPGAIPSAVHRPPTLRERLLLIAPTAIFVAATTQWMTWSEPIRLLFAGDVDNYTRIAVAAPHFTWPQITGHVSMWPVHYVVGTVSWATHLPVHATYYVFAIAVLAFLVAVLDRILVRLGVGVAAYGLAMGTALLNPYVFRYLALAPGMINDTVFIACVALVVLALLERRTTLLVVALTVAALARGWSTPPVQLAAAAWLLADGGIVLRRRRRGAAAAIVLPFTAFGVAYWIGTLTPGHAQVVKDCCSLTTITLLGDIVHLPGSAHAIALHLARTAIGIAMPLALLSAVGILVLGRRLRGFRPLDWWLLAVSATLVSEPLLLSSSWNEGAEPRLVAYAVPALVAVTALAVDRVAFGARETVVLYLLVAAASLSHRFASIGPRSAGQFAALVFACGAAVFLGVIVRRMPLAGRAPVASAPPQRPS